MIKQLLTSTSISRQGSVSAAGAFNSLKTVVTALLLTLMTGFGVSKPVYAHRVVGDEIDTCKIKVGPGIIHFTAYTPTFTQNQDYCKSIPNVGPTNLVFDYVGKKLRDISVEFEVTKEPEGTRVFYQAPKKIKTGNLNDSVDFSQYGPGKYLIHVTIMDEGKELDTHLPFWVGVKPDSDGIFGGVMIGKLLLTVTILAALLYFLIQLYKSKDEQDSSQEPPAS